MSTLIVLDTDQAQEFSLSPTIPTTLYDLVEAMQEAAKPGEEALIVPALVDLFQSRRVIWALPG